MSQLLSLKLQRSLKNMPSVGIPQPDFETRSPAYLESDIAISKIIPAQVDGRLGPGILTVTLYEGDGLSAPEQSKEAFEVHLRESVNYPDERWLHLHLLYRTYLPYHPICLPYALLRFDNSETFVGSISGTTDRPLWAGEKIQWKFDVTRASELTVSLHLKSPDTSTDRQDISLGMVRLLPLFSQTKSDGAQWLEIEDGTGRICIGVSYTPSQLPETPDFEHTSYNGPGSLGAIEAWRKTDTQQFYACKRTQASSSPRCDINSPFILPLTLASQSPTGLYLFLPFVTGGHLFYYIQREQFFSMDKARFYAAEILCAIDHLHGLDIVYGGLAPQSILLHSSGHIVIAESRLYLYEGRQDKKRASSSSTVVTAPEVLLGQDYCKQSDCWAFGALLHEMITGLPPFYDERLERTQQRIVSHSIRFQDPVSQSAQDLLKRLLECDPDKRLGAKGAFEIKAHSFFTGLDWDKFSRRECEPPAKPCYTATVFKEHRGPSFSEKIKQFVGFKFKTPGSGIFEPPQPISSIEIRNPGTMNTASSKDSTVAASNMKETTTTICRFLTPSPAVDDDHQAWELVWEENSGAFCLQDHFTGARRSVATRPKYPGMSHRTVNTGVHLEKDSPGSEGNAAKKVTLHRQPTQSQKEDVLEHALAAGRVELARQLLVNYGSMDLNIHVLRPHQTPLMWATVQEKVDLVGLFLNHGADPSFNFAYLGCKAAISIAVEKRNREIVQLLVTNTSRMLCTIALGLAVDQEDLAMATTLLANGVECDFEESDRPPRPRPEQGCFFEDMSYAAEFTPVLARAIKMGNMALVRLLLAHGANVNVGYHNIPQELPQPGIEYERPSLACGRVVQLAMDLGRRDIVRVLLEHGADINLPQPTWRHHQCDMVPRDVYFRIIAGLRAEASVMKGGVGSEKVS